MHLVMDPEVNGSNPGGVKCFSISLSFESNSSDIHRFMFIFRGVQISFFARSLFNCSQTKCVAITLVLFCFSAILRLADFSSECFSFSSLDGIK